MKFLKLVRMEPYRVLFPIGMLFLGVGVSFWILYLFNPSGPYPGANHARFMIQGFLISFAMGFLLTSVPRFTRTRTPDASEAVFAVILTVLSGFYDWASFLALCLIGVFAYRRKMHTREVRIPDFFYFILVGFIFGLLGSLLKTVSPGNLLFYRAWLYEGMMLLWLCGIGSKVIWNLRGQNGEELSKKENHITLALLALAIFLTPFHPILAQFCDFAKGSIVVYLWIRVWGITHVKKSDGALSLGIWIALINFSAGFFIRSFVPHWGVHALHIIFIGGYTALALLVSTRIAIAHGGDGTRIEKGYWRIFVFTLLLSAAAYTRFVVAILPSKLYFPHLAYAAGTLLVALVLWASLVLPRLKRQ